MADIDLVPAGYRRLLLLQRRLQTFGVAVIALLSMIVLTKMALAYSVRGMQGEIERLDAAFALENEGKARLDALRKEHEQAERRARILEGLRGGVAAREMFSVIDRAGQGEVWFTDWNFRRAGEVVPNDPKAVQSGFFLVVPLEGRGKEPDKAWLMQTHMEIRGRASDHRDLAAFVRRLVQQPEIEDVKILNTSMNQRSQRETVGFELAVVVRTSA